MGRARTCVSCVETLKKPRPLARRRPRLTPEHCYSPSVWPGFRIYTRPEGKGGGHGVGWSEFPPYSFKVPPGWEEFPVSIADPAGTELDLKFASKDKKTGGEASVLIEPVLRFMDVGFNASVKVTDVGDPMKLVTGFGPELIGGPIEEFQLAKMDIDTLPNGLPVYRYEILPAFKGDPHCFVSITAARNRVYILNAKTPEPLLQYREKNLRAMMNSFTPVIAAELEAELKAELKAGNTADIEVASA